MVPRSLLSVFLLCALTIPPGLEAIFKKKSVVEEEPKEHCYAFERHPYLGFASKTSYEEVYNKAGITPLKGCKVVQLWMVIRHGTRYPGDDNLPDFEVSRKLKDQVIENHANKSGTLCDADLAALQKYNIKLDPHMANRLSPQGRKDLYNLGQRVRRSFSDIFADKSYTPEQFLFRYTPTPRTQESAEQFFRGVFGLSFHSDAHPLPKPIKELIHLYSNCTGWEQASEKNKVHRANFCKGEHIQKVIEEVSHRLGFKKKLSMDKLKTIYNECRFYEAWNVDERSPWCAAFTKKDLLALEYMEDLNYYYKSGPGHPWNLRLACPLVKNMYDHFSEKVTNMKEKYMPRAMFYFSHSILLNQLSAGLGLRDDADPLTEHNYPQKANRNFRTTEILPFTANIIAVLYKCKTGPDTWVPKVRFFHSEHPVNYPGCTNGICEWSFIKKKFDPYVNDPICTDMSFCTSEITKPKSRKEIAIQVIKENSTAIYISTITVLSLIIAVPMAVNGVKAFTGRSSK